MQTAAHRPACERQSEDAIEGVLERLRDMLVRDSDSPFRVKYREALQHSPEVVLAHAAVAKRIGGGAY